jgi:hypothetical protein
MLGLRLRDRLVEAAVYLKSGWKQLPPPPSRCATLAATLGKSPAISAVEGTGLGLTDAVVVQVNVVVLSLCLSQLTNTCNSSHAHTLAANYGRTPNTGQKTDAYGSLISEATRGASTNINLHPAEPALPALTLTIIISHV